MEWFWESLVIAWNGVADAFVFFVVDILFFWW